MRKTQFNSKTRARSSVSVNGHRADRSPRRSAPQAAYAEDLTADFAYIRWHGSEQLYFSGYSEQELEWWANRIEHWRSGRQPTDAKVVGPAKADRKPRPVFVYFDNDAKVHAPFDAIRLATRLRVQPVE
jgi:uncharacterized protein YecE (DUF72 family)